jgi:LysM repeat protein
MKKTSKYLTRLLVVLALAAVVVAVIVIVSSFKVDSNDKTSGNGKAHPAKQNQKQPQRTQAKTYTVQSGDTLIAIAHKTGVPVAELQALNPEIDPQILIAGEVLKLR